MALTLEKIGKLRELADRGIGGEKENAKSILTAAGIDWRKPKEKIIDSIKEGVGVNIKKQYSLPIDNASDLLLVATIVRMLNIDAQMYVQNASILLKCTPAQSKEVGNLFYKMQKSFDTEMRNYAFKNLTIEK